jgi:hypothetical protein
MRKKCVVVTSTLRNLLDPWERRIQLVDVSALDVCCVAGSHVLTPSVAPSPSPEPHRVQAANPYRPIDNRPPQQIFDLDLDLNPDL